MSDSVSQAAGALASLAKLDIVERLRDSQSWEKVGPRHDMLREAADEIEQLRGVICWTLDAMAGGSTMDEIEEVLRRD